MDVLSVINDGKSEDYDKVLIMLHGGGSLGEEWNYPYN
jgi:hypothetical protein